MSDLEKSLRRNGMIIIVFGFVLALAVIPLFHKALWLFTQLAYWPLTTVPQGLLAPAGVFVAISGGLTTGLGAAMWGLGAHVAPVAPDAARRVAVLMGWSWFSVDSTASVLTGAPMNAVLNLIFLFLILQAARAGKGAQAVA
ncbi:MAG: hypothetical protein AAFU41_17000 [Pseudomonadota bacterium]